MVWIFGLFAATTAIGGSYVGLWLVLGEGRGAIGLGIFLSSWAVASLFARAGVSVRRRAMNRALEE